MFYNLVGDFVILNPGCVVLDNKMLDLVISG